MTVTVHVYVLVQSYKGKTTKLGVYNTPSEARFNLEIALNKFIDEQYGEDLSQACYKQETYSAIVTSKDNRHPRMILQVEERVRIIGEKKND